MRRFFASALAAGTALLAGCSFYHKEFFQTGSRLVEPNDFVLQIDDLGMFWNKEVAQRALDAIETESRRTNTVVVLYVHGWHHTAAVDDTDLADVAKTLQVLRSRLVDNHDGTPGPFRTSRINLTRIPEISVIGIYVGWRGKSLPMPLNYGTFWGRKAAAERVGDGDLREFLQRLNRIYQDRQREFRLADHVPFMGLATIGHSFGGQVLFKTVAETFEQQLTGVTDRDPTKTVALQRPLVGFGDLVILLNPAVEALQYERIHQLSRRIRFDRYQMPLLLVLSSENDYPRRWLFPIGRAAADLFRPRFTETQFDLWRTALGEYTPQRTHRIDELSEAEASELMFDPGAYLKEKCKIVNFDLTDIPVLGKVKLAPLKTHEQPFNPFIVAFTDRDIFPGHTEIFQQELNGALLQYIAINQGKRMVLTDPSIRECGPPDAVMRERKRRARTQALTPGGGMAQPAD